MVTDVLAYTYEADIHCHDCAAARFGVDSSGYICEDSVDDEGNEVGAQFDDDSWVDFDTDELEQQVLACRDCFTILDARCIKCLNSLDGGDYGPTWVFQVRTPIPGRTWVGTPGYCRWCTESMKAALELVPLA